MRNVTGVGGRDTLLLSAEAGLLINPDYPPLTVPPLVKLNPSLWPLCLLSALPPTQFDDLKSSSLHEVMIGGYHHVLVKILIILHLAQNPMFLSSQTQAIRMALRLIGKAPLAAVNFLVAKLVSWSNKKQKSVSTSTAEAEYVAAGSCCAQILWMKNQLRDYNQLYSHIPILCDNSSAIAITNNPVLHSRSKHIDIRYHFIRDHISKCDVELHFIPTDLQLADLFTKPLDEARFKFLIGELGMLNIDL
ncbi:hypothetical protein L6452_02956 [Arctium lappa]|uniref:Uncharacterized protein n=1 Tax=Arctium lappa TaxID=4217 RepID=A0ACB9FKB7_ARCLA|nr:hypothetical protein L6452_02956 [Arctium lappa]